MQKNKNSETLLRNGSFFSKSVGAVRTVLLVEDDESMRELMQWALESEGYHVKLAKNGAEGLEQIVSEPSPSVVLLDMGLPIMHGSDFLKLVKADEELSQIPIVVVSGDKNLGTPEGAEMILTKPTSLSKIINVVSEQCQMPKKREDRILQ